VARIRQQPLQNWKPGAIRRGCCTVELRGSAPPGSRRKRPWLPRSGMPTASQSSATPASYRMASAPLPTMALASEGRRLIEAAAGRVVVRDGSIEIAFTRDAAAIVGEAAVVAAWRKPPARVGRELIPPIEGVHQNADSSESCCAISSDRSRVNVELPVAGSKGLGGERVNWPTFRTKYC
jgi:hypothetical protein